MIEELETGEMKGMIGMMIIDTMMIEDEMTEETQWMIEGSERGENEMKGIFPSVTEHNSKCKLSHFKAYRLQNLHIQYRRKKNLLTVHEVFYKKR